MKSIENFIENLSRLDCGSNSCEFAHNKYGQRSNGGCQCLGGYRDSIRIPVIQLWRAMKDKFMNGPMTAQEKLHDVKVPLIDVPKEQLLKVIKKFEEMVPSEYQEPCNKVKVNIEQKPLDADIEGHINKHFDELL